MPTKAEMQKACSSQARIECISTPEWGGDGVTRIRVLRGTDYDKACKIIREHHNKDGPGFAKMCILCICDEHGNPILNDSDFEWLIESPAPVLKRCGEKAIELNLLDGASILELEKNYDATTIDEHGSGSPANVVDRLKKPNRKRTRDNSRNGSHFNASTRQSKIG